MGWGSGSELMDAVIKSSQTWVEDETQRFEFYRELIEAFEQRDWDTQGDCLGRDPIWDGAFKKDHPEWYEDE